MRRLPRNKAEWKSSLAFERVRQRCRTDPLATAGTKRIPMLVSTICVARCNLLPMIEGRLDSVMEGQHKIRGRVLSVAQAISERKYLV